LSGFHVRGMPPSWFNGPPPPGQANMGWKFPELLGKMSTRNKRQRQLMEMHTAMQGRSSGGRMDLLTFVLPALVSSRAQALPSFWCSILNRFERSAVRCSRRGARALRPQSQSSTSTIFCPEI
jgi:hypothetical protein